MPKVAIIVGSSSDDEAMKGCIQYLEYFGIEYNYQVLSAHRNPDECVSFVRNAESNGYKIIIAAAGMAAHLPGVAAANTILPVIGVPLSGSELKGVDALYSIVQMPSGIPVATVAIGGSKNAAVLAAEILALDNSTIKLKLINFKKNGSKI
ncbi:MAG: 5-(carboxyamino)imidazole ribonucleotide mutase [Ignavibacteria bacterium]|nr:5-(carboxyamino)imidazole ribonucleotide mutase [Bacteroidota bacterium]MSQ45549.1 5-(carboxyamino)imidazole ribonucleotide mutase [Ignavibacteria bacterium]